MITNEYMNNQYVVMNDEIYDHKQIVLSFLFTYLIMFTYLIYIYLFTLFFTYLSIFLLIFNLFFFRI